MRSQTRALMLAVVAQIVSAKGPFLHVINETHSVIGNDLWNITQGPVFTTKLYYKEKDLVGDTVGHYVSYNGAASNLNLSSPTIVSRTHNSIDVSYTSPDGDFHWVIYSDLAGAYQYFVNRALPVLGEFRTFFRLDNTTFPNGKTSRKDGPLPPFEEYVISTKVQDETWQKADGSYLTKNDWSAFLREEDYYGVYGPDVGSWYIYPGKDEYNGNHLKQELMIHRESQTGDAVQLNMIHGTHFQASATDAFAVNKTWSPWLWLLGSKEDAASRAKREASIWPYKWFQDPGYQARGSVSGTLKLSNGRPAAGAAVFLGDNYPNKTSLDMGQYNYYTAYADKGGRFRFENVRTGSYAFQAWSNGGALAAVPGAFLRNDVVVIAKKNNELPELKWTPRYAEKDAIFRVGNFDRKTLGFKNGGAPYTHGLVDSCSANLNFTIGKSKSDEWCFGQSANGTWAINFEVPRGQRGGESALLTVSLAGFSTGTSSDIYFNNAFVSNLTSGAGSTTDFSKGLANDPGMYRSATTAGEWRQFEFIVPKTSFNEGRNKVEFRVTRSTRWRGFMWGAISLAWV